MPQPHSILKAKNSIEFDQDFEEFDEDEPEIVIPTISIATDSAKADPKSTPPPNPKIIKSAPAIDKPIQDKKEKGHLLPMPLDDDADGELGPRQASFASSSNSTNNKYPNAREIS